ncbi:bacteriophage antitermination protein Q [Shewanella glacialipiscicola]|uniref:bacteriophage antitermination protein Q n=1 Tax=Shewanella TaxID=22 RepID=UPI003D799873
MIEPQTLYAIRVEILSALHIDVRTRGQLDFDGSMITKYGTKKRPVDSVTGERFDPEPVRGRSGRTFKCSSCPLPPDAFSLIKTSRAVTMLPEHLNSLALYAYSERCEWHHVEIVAAAIWQRLLVTQDKPFRAKKEKTLKGMVFLAMQNWRHLLTAENDLHTPQRIRELLDISENLWRRDWLPFWRQLHDLLSETDHQVLTHVYQATSQPKKARNKSTAAAA